MGVLCVSFADVHSRHCELQTRSRGSPANMPRLQTERIAGWSSRWLTDELTALSRAGNWDAALETFAAVSGAAGPGGGSAMVSTNVYHYTTLISACARHGQWRPALNCYAHMRERGIEPNVKTFTSIIHACGAAGRADLASRAYALLQCAGVIPNVHSMTALVTAFSRSGSWNKAVAVLIDSEDDLACNPNVFSYTAAMDGCRRAGRWDVAMALLHRMEARGVEPNSVTFNTAIAACAPTEQWAAASAAFAMMRGHGVKPTAYTQTNLIQAFENSPLQGQATDLLYAQRAQTKLEEGDSAELDSSGKDVYDSEASTSETRLRPRDADGLGL
jgi:pentatricopeptide repeat domain-containing protein 1